MVEVAEIFHQYGEEYRRQHKLSSVGLKAMKAIENCRTSKLGGHVDECDECGHLKISYNSCRNRHCPKCQSLAKEQWLEERKKDLLPIPYFHIVFTLPHELRTLAAINKKQVYSLLYKASSRTLIELSKDPKYLGANIGFLSILHTWGQNLMDHPHIHSIVTGGGLSFDEKQWLSSKKDFYLPVKVMSRLFRGKFLFYLKQSYQQEKIKLPIQMTEFQKLIDNLYQKEWVVYCKPPFKNSQYVLEYLSRYTHRVAISNNRIIKFESDKVTFKWKDYKQNQQNKYLTLDIYEFIRRFLLHILPQGFVKIRYYGILSNRNRETKLKRCKEIFHIHHEEAKTKITWQELLFKITGIDPALCPKCKKGRLIHKQEFKPKCFSPPLIQLITF